MAAMALEAHDRAGQGANDSVNSLDVRNGQLPKRVHAGGCDPGHNVVGSGDNDGLHYAWDLGQLLGNLGLSCEFGLDENVGVDQRIS
jgi:hypothetical protein